MYKMKLGLSVSHDFGIPISEQIALLKKIGFEAFATMYDSDEKLSEYRRIADECGIEYNYIHAPYSNSAKMWTDCAEEAVAELLHCVD